MKSELPVLQDLYNDIAIAKKENDLTILLNQEPKKSWIKAHPFVTGARYVPIERIEYLLTSIFKVWNVEVKNIQLIANSVVVTIRLYYKDPISGTMLFHDGVGACSLKTDKGAGAIEFDKLKDSAVMTAAPAAESYAIKDAADKLGKLFGKDLNRADQIGYNVLQKSFEENDKLISQSQFAFIEGLIKTSSFDDDTKEQLEMELTALTESKVKDFISNLEMNQLAPKDRGNMSQTEINQAIDEKG